MAKITPEQDAAYALRFGVARSSLSAEAQIIYDRLAEQQKHSQSPALPPLRDAEAAGSQVAMPRLASAAVTVLSFPMGPGLVVVLLPFLITRWHEGASYPLVVRVLGVALIAVGGLLMVAAFVRFPVEGEGVPFPTIPPSSQRVIVGGPYRYVRNPMYVAFGAAIAGQALLLGRPVLLVYAAALLAALVAFVRLYEERTMLARYGESYEAYRQRVPGWWPRLPHRAP